MEFVDFSPFIKAQNDKILVIFVKLSYRAFGEVSINLKCGYFANAQYDKNSSI